MLIGLLCFIFYYPRRTSSKDLLISATSYLVLDAFSVSNCVGNVTDGRSTIGFCILLRDSPISWKSKKQLVVSRSSVEVEYQALLNMTFEIIWLLIASAKYWSWYSISCPFFQWQQECYSNCSYWHIPWEHQAYRNWLFFLGIMSMMQVSLFIQCHYLNKLQIYLVKLIPLLVSIIF